jgi:D-arginine dehydrogenase
MSEARHRLKTDVLIIGAGMAGASVAWHLHGRARVIIIDQEAYAGYHTTGRSAAFYSEIYGGPDVLPLNASSKSFLFSPPSDFSSVPLTAHRGALYAAREDQRPLLDEMYRGFNQAVPSLRFLSTLESCRMAPMLQSEWLASALYDPECKDLNVAALHAGYLRGAELYANEKVMNISRSAARWKVETSTLEIDAAIIVNSAGAWGDDVARLAGVKPVGLIPCRRTIITFRPEVAAVDPNGPLVLDAGEQFYFKPDGADIWASPADETPSLASDVQAEELDVAITIDRIQTATHYVVKTIKRKWAGLRTFAPDRLPVYGYDSSAPDFFWCVGQGGWGIQTAPAAGALCAALLLGQALPEELLKFGITASRYAPDRFAADA